ncbi:carbohydrate ABC transporter permease [Pseudonocardia hispaniensis]|uniref:Carbohydrate ABC transporter permease n=1 Tax=Pseudonocardia hispaniensis TaxID=904933 RepID=A0ABW1J242_9PSEU
MTRGEVAAERAADREPAARPPTARRRRSLFDREGPLAALLLLPSIVYIIGLVAIPFVLAIAFSLSSATVGDPTLRWVGLANFQRALADPVFRTSLLNSVLITVIALACVVLLATALALVLSKDFRGKWFFRFLVLLPWTTPVSLVSILWLWMFDTLYSPIDWVLRAVGLIDGNLNWLGTPQTAFAAVIIAQVWRITPLAAVIVLAGLLSVPPDVDEQAQIDGAGFWRKTFQITLPLTLPIIAVATLFGGIMIFIDLTTVYVLTRGGPINATQILPTWAFFRGIEGGDLGQGAAIALFLFPVLLTFAILILRAVRRSEVT